MSSLQTLIAAWDEAHREFAIALNGTPDGDVWRRAHPRLLSAGELAGHVAHWQAVWCLGGGSDRPDLDQFPIDSPLIDDAFRYYTGSVEAPVERALTAQQLIEEVGRIHEAAKAAAGGKEPDTRYPGMWQTWGNLVQYQAFHVAYHTGQVYSVRHLMGHVTEDN